MRFEQTLFVQAPREAVWNLIADTDRLNREMGLPPISFTFEPREAGGTQALATVQYAGLTLRYREHPFEWLRPRFHFVRRTFFGGPIREIRCGAELREADGGTYLTVFAELDPAGPAGALVCKAVGRKSVADFVSAFRRFEAFLLQRAATPYPRHSRRPPADRARLQQSLERLRAAGADPHLAECLASYLAACPPEDAVGLRPFVVADSLGLDRMAMLQTCLLAARTGLLDLRWRILCPACRGGRNTLAHLSDVAGEKHCDTCNIRFGATFDRSVEVCFDVARAIRPVQVTTYCIGGPGLSPHAAAQWILAPGERRETPVEVLPGEYRLASLQAEDPAELTIAEPGAGTVCVRIRSVGRRARIGTEGNLPICPSAAWMLVNETRETVILRLETPRWTTESATAALVTSLQAFRDQFSSEVLSPGVELSVQQICILFSDLKGSTAMYRAQGDAPSYRAVRDHFEWMRRIIAARRGAVVKTIGDAVMAAFHDSADGLAAALEMQRAASSHPDGLVVKLGLHWGPAIAINANDRLDYFGQTVNLAARLQRESAGRDIVLAADVAGDPQVSRLLDDPAIRMEPFSAIIRGLEEPIEMLRIFSGRSN